MSQDMWGGTGSIDLAVSDYRALKRAPEVVLLGSSLMMYPFWAMDKETNPAIPDIFHHHNSIALQNEMAKIGFPSPSVYSFAIFGQMVSDAYIYVNEYLKGTRTPEYLVYGIAPRDFSDYDLPAPMATLTFKRLVSLENFASYANLYLPGFQEKADFIAGRICYFYGKRWKLQNEVNKGFDKAYAFLGIAKPEAGAAANTEATAGFMLAGSNEERWKNSLNEYKRRYRNIAEKDLSVQTGFLKRLLATCAERGIKVVLVNMPLTDVNRQLFPSGFYEKYCSELNQIANRPGVKFVDLGASSEFTHDDFWDTTHLNHAGGRKMLPHVVAAIAELGKTKVGNAAGTSAR